MAPQLTPEKRGLLLHWKSEGASHREVARRLGCSPSTVTYWLQSIRNEARLTNKGRPAPAGRATSQEEDDQIVQLSKDNPFLPATAIRKSLNMNFVSVSTIKRRLHEAGLHSRIAAQKPKLSAVSKRNRLDFANDHRQWKKDDWAHVIFSDESSFCSSYCTKKRVWRLDGHRYDEEYQQPVCRSGRVSVSVWGCFTYRGLGPLIRIPGNLNSNTYISIINDVLMPWALDGFGFDGKPLFPEGDFFYQQDRASVHGSEVVKEHLEDMFLTVLQWPAQGADMNPMENIWALMKKEIVVDRRTTPDILWEVVKQQWELLRGDQLLMEHLSSSMPRRLRCVRNGQGAFTKY